MRDSKISSTTNPMLVLGWDGAEWSRIDALCSAGLMPHLQSLREYGFEAKIASLQPMLSPLLWTSVVTGKRAHEHGILGFVEESMHGPRPISNQMRKVPALWNILSEAGLHCQVLNWWPSNPAEVIHGDFVSNLAFADGELGSQTYPEAWTSVLTEIKMEHPDLDAEVQEFFSPNASNIPEEGQELYRRLHRILLRSKWQYEVALRMLEKQSDCRFFYFEALDQIQHLALEIKAKPDVDYLPENFAEGLINAAYRWHDAILGVFLKQLAGHNIILLSDHGFDLSAAKPLAINEIPGAPAAEHKAFGFFCAAGPDIQADAAIYGLSLLDICPSLLHYFKLPVAKDMPGLCRPTLFKSQVKPSFIPTWNVLGKAGFIETEKLHANASLLQDLEDLDYIQIPKEGVKDFIREEHNYNAAISLKESGDYNAALDLANSHWLISRKAYRWYLLKARLHLALADVEGFNSFWSSLSSAQQKSTQLQFYKALNNLQAGHADAAIVAMQRLQADAYSSPALHAELAHALMLSGNLVAANQQFDLALAQSENYTSALNGKAQVAFENADWTNFQYWANRALSQKIFQPQLHFLWANYYSLQGMLEEAKQALEICLQMAPKHQKALALKTKLMGGEEQDYTYIVSGFPRSGTSLMMALLQKAGIPIFSDGKRAADNHNPKGYFEWEGLKQLPFGAELPDTKNQALKVVAPLLPYLPADRRYKVIWMDRPIFELVISQAKMNGQSADLENFPFQKGQQLEAEKKRFQNWLDQQAHIEWINISYPKLCAKDGSTLLAQINAFVGRQISEDDWHLVVDPQLHRNKIG